MDYNGFDITGSIQQHIWTQVRLHQNPSWVSSRMLFLLLPTVCMCLDMVAPMFVCLIACPPLVTLELACGASMFFIWTPLVSSSPHSWAVDRRCCHLVWDLTSGPGSRKKTHTRLFSFVGVVYIWAFYGCKQLGCGPDVCVWVRQTCGC